ncbi:RusA family crossover junction endodeoxyribonuclease [Paraburkholderia caribensis]|uniref:RusA family crossover junction endodeoxyribonuclease n=1 Tax=Paraburkholderia caribensis TaxID=75105 RepID=UPI001D07BE83|nr:RusA family crossover junction endodeoxyribonuclease [Paraburkholderia caribensis]
MLTVTLPYPISANRYWASRLIKPKAGKPFISTYVTPEAESYKTEVGWRVRTAGLRSPIKGRVAVAYTLYPARPQDWATRQRKLGDAWHDAVRCIDLDNAQKVLLDALKGVAFEDDVWVRRITAERAEPDGEARIVVRVTAIETPQPQAAFDLPAQPALAFDDPLGL